MSELLTSSVWRGYRSEFVLGLFAGGATTGLLLGATATGLSVIPEEIRLGALGVGLLATTLVCLVRGVDALPQRRRLVPVEIAGHQREGGPFQFGLELGTGFRTFSPSPLPLLVATSVALMGDLLCAVAVGLAFAAGRAVFAFGRLRSVRRGTWDRAWEVHARSLLFASLVVALTMYLYLAST